MKSGAPPAISRLLVSLAHAMAISRLALVGWLDLGLDHTRSSARCGSAGRRTTMPSPGMTRPPVTTLPMIPALPHHLAVAIASKNSVEQTWLESIDLSARVAQPGDLDDRLGPNAQLRAAGQCEQVQIPGGDVFAELTRLDVEALRIKLSEQLGVDEVHLSKVGLGRVCGDV